jgi:hypothetical protein
VKIVGALLLVFLGSGAWLAQEVTNAPGVQVVSQRWHREELNPALLEDPLVYGTNRNPERASKEVDQQNNAKPKANRILLPDSPEQRTQRSNESASTEYVYEAKILNSSGQTIRRIDWQFDLFDPASKEVVGHHTFTSKTDLRPGKTTKLVGRNRSNPTSVIDASKAGVNSMNQFTIEVIINRIEYDSGQVWLRDPK